MENSSNQVLALLGPTNTGKTYVAIEKMLKYESGIFGFPLRLLAREVYDKVIKKVSIDKVALITGEEKIIPSEARYFLCTVESMPIDKNLEFVGVDEIQMCSDQERGHIFTERLLNLRGEKLTMFMGSNSMKSIIEKLDGDIEYIDRKRLSKLTYSGHKKISRIERKTAIIAFSAEEVYAIAELIRRQKGGAAIVMGSLSPKTRNAQVELYQSGDVDFLVATDAIGMGIKMGFFESDIVQEEAKKLFTDYQELMKLGSEYGKFDREGKKMFIKKMESLMDRYKVFMKRFELSEDFQAKMTVEQLKTQLNQFGITPEQMFDQMNQTLLRMKDELEKNS